MPEVCPADHACKTCTSASSIRKQQVCNVYGWRGNLKQVIILLQRFWFSRHILLDSRVPLYPSSSIIRSCLFYRLSVLTCAHPSSLLVLFCGLAWVIWVDLPFEKIGLCFCDLLFANIPWISIVLLCHCVGVKLWAISHITLKGNLGLSREM